MSAAQSGGDPMPPLLRIRDLHKAFPGVVALNGVSLEVAPGEVHAVLGENGAGKSTLVKLVSGVHVPDAGTIELDGVPVQVRDPHDAIRLGISTIYQEFNLLPDMTVAENIMLGREPMGTLPGTVSYASIWQSAALVLERIGSQVSPRARVGDLSVADQQMVEIAKALAFRSRLLIFDEPTAALTEPEAERLFAIIRQLAGDGVGVIYISHRLEEAKQLAQKATILRNGELVGTVAMESTSVSDLIRMMIGRDIAERFPRTHAPLGEVLLRVDGLSDPPRFQDVGFDVRAGEIVALAGLIGAGRTEVARALFGLAPHATGRVEIAGVERTIRDPRDAMRAGLAYLPEDRKADGLALVRPVRENLTMTIVDRIAPRWVVERRRDDASCSQQVRDLDIRVPSVGVETQYLSGGNQQKVVLGKWLNHGARVFIFDEPTRGVDVGAKVQIYRQIDALAAGGAAVVLISSELPEVLGMADRIVVMAFGRVTGSLSRDEASAESVLHLAFAQTGVTT